MGKWTPEPWRGWDAYDIVGPGNQTVINDAIFWTTQDRDRAVACVNALAGLNPEAVVEAVETLRAIAHESGTVIECGRATLALAHARLARTALSKLRQEPTQ